MKFKNKILIDREIEALSLKENMITPFRNKTESKSGVLSWGLTSFGYDISLGAKFKRSRASAYPLLDPKKVPVDFFEDFTVGQGKEVYVPAGGYLLGVSVERLKLPKNICGLCVGKSTYARAGLMINTTPLEPEWEGHITIEIANLESVPVKIYPGEGIMQVIFHSSKTSPRVTYEDKKGKYQGQTSKPIASI